MANLIRMDLRRMFRSPMFFVSLAVIGVFNILLNVGLTMAARFFVPSQAMNKISQFHLPPCQSAADIL